MSLIKSCRISRLHRPWFQRIHLLPLPPKYRQYWSVMTPKTWQQIAAKKREERISKIPKEWQVPENTIPSDDVLDISDWPKTSGFFTEAELLITESTASEVVKNIASGRWSSEEVVRAICKRASVAQQFLNCVTEICFEEAITRAKELDTYFSKEKKTVGPLHGLPISFKDQFNIKGLDSTIGYVAWANKPATEDSTLVEMLVAAGAVPYVKTNVPATLMRGETVNNIFGRTVNPRNRQLTTGGSSGGESALVTFRGSFIGVGTDIGGSIRHPCSFTGLYGLRPSHGRVSYQRVANTFLGQEAVRSCAGPMCRSPEDIRLFMSTIATQKPWLEDPQAVPIPWRTEQEALPKKLCFGFGMHDETVQSSPPMQRAMNITKAALTAAGHSFIDFIPTEHIEASDLIMRFWSADGGQEFQRDTDLSGEPLHPETEGWLGHSANAKPQTVFETWQNQHQRALLATKWLEKWQATKEKTGTGRPIDGLIMPSTPFPAVKHNSSYPWHWGALSPLLDLTTGVFPVTKMLAADEVPPDFKPLSALDQEVMDFYGKPEDHENALVGLVVIGRRLEEEKVTAMLEVIKEALSNEVKEI